MLPGDKKKGLSRIEFYVVAALLVVALWSIWEFGINNRPRILDQLPAPTTDTGQNQPSATLPSPSDWQKMSVTVEDNRDNLLTTLATALFGAIGWLVFEARKTPDARETLQKPKKRHRRAVFLAALCTVVSLFCGAASQRHLVAMLSSKDFTPYDPVYSLLNLAQLGFLGAGACFLAGFAIYDLGEEDQHEN